MNDPDLHLFVDNYEIHQISNLRRMLNQPYYLPEPVLRADEKWELGCGAVAWGTIMKDRDDSLRMWYQLVDWENRDWGNAYAESSDGIHWEKPRLGRVEWRGNKENNIFLKLDTGKPPGNVNAMDGYTMVRDDDDRPSRRYKLLAFMHDNRMWARAHPDQHDRYITDEEIERASSVAGLYLWSSPDGISFPGSPEFLQHTYGDYLKIIRDHRHGRWLLNTRIPQYQDVTAGHKYRRNVGIATSTDLRRWSPIDSVILNEDDNAFGRLWEWHGLTPFTYGNLDLGLLDIQDSVYPTGICELVSHRDGMPWRRVMPGRYFLDRGPEGTYYRGGGMPTHNEPIRVGDELLFYFNTGNAEKPGGRVHPRVVGAAKVRLDRFVALAHGHAKTGEPAGMLVTKPFIIRGDELEVNVESFWESVPRGGSVRVGVLNPDATAIEGYRIDDCRPVQGNVLREPVRWESRESLRELRDRTVMLVFSVTQARFYSYRIATELPPGRGGRK